MYDIQLEMCVPTASSAVFFTQLWHPTGDATNVAGVVLIQCMFFVFFISFSNNLPFLDIMSIFTLVFWLALILSTLVD
jgi:hypothetical protein